MAYIKLLCVCCSPKEKKKKKKKKKKKERKKKTFSYVWPQKTKLNIYKMYILQLQMINIYKKLNQKIYMYIKHGVYLCMKME